MSNFLMPGPPIQRVPDKADELDTRTALIDALRLAVKNAGERSSSGLTRAEIYSYVEAQSMLQQIDWGLERSDEEIRAALDNLLG